MQRGTATGSDQGSLPSGDMRATNNVVPVSSGDFFVPALLEVGSPSDDLSVETYSELIAQRTRFMALQPNLVLLAEHLQTIQAWLTRERDKMLRMQTENSALVSEIQVYMPEVNLNMVSAQGLIDKLAGFIEGDIAGTLRDVAHVLSATSRGNDGPFCSDISTPGRSPQMPSWVKAPVPLPSGTLHGESSQAGARQDSHSNSGNQGSCNQVGRSTPAYGNPQAEVSRQYNQDSCNMGRQSVHGSASRPEQARGSNRRQPRPMAPGTTTLMVRNVPARYTKERLVLEWPVEIFRFNMLYLPANKRGMSLGYSFINFLTPDDALAFQRRWHGRYLANHGANNKHLDISEARVQGLAESLRDMLEHMDRPAWRRESCIPLVFEGARSVDIHQVLHQHGLHLPTSD